MFVSNLKAAFAIHLVSATLLLLAGTRLAHADYYKYTDKTGVVCMTNSRDSVPKEYRATMKVIREDTLDKKDKGSRIDTLRRDAPATESPAVVEAGKETAPVVPESAFGKLLSRFPWFRGVIVGGALLGAFLIVRKLASLLPSPLLGRLICLVFFLGASVFVYKSYSDNLSASYFDLKTKFTGLLEKANRREVPTAEPGESALPHPGTERSSQ